MQRVVTILKGPKAYLSGSKALGLIYDSPLVYLSPPFPPDILGILPGEMDQPEDLSSKKKI